MNILHFQDSYIVSNEQEISHSVSHYAPQALKVTLSCDFFPTRLSTIKCKGNKILELTASPILLGTTTTDIKAGLGQQVHPQNPPSSLPICPSACGPQVTESSQQECNCYANPAICNTGTD